MEISSDGIPTQLIFIPSLAHCIRFRDECGQQKQNILLLGGKERKYPLKSIDRDKKQ